MDRFAERCHRSFADRLADGGMRVYRTDDIIDRAFHVHTEHSFRDKFRRVGSYYVDSQYIAESFAGNDLDKSAVTFDTGFAVPLRSKRPTV